MSTTINMSRDDLKDILAAAIYYLGGEVERAKTAGLKRDVIRVRGTFDELLDELAEQDKEDAKHA